MNTLVFSDLHLGDNFDARRLKEFLMLVEKFDRIILNGDFLDDHWDYAKTVTSQWKPLFDVFSRKETLYLFGNHDRDSVALRQATSSFITEFYNMYVLPVGEQELVIMHGHSIYPRPDDILYKDMKTWYGKIIQKIAKILWFVMYPIILTVRYFIEKYPHSLAKLQRPVIEVQNERMKKFAKDNLKQYQILVCGHSHLAEYSPDAQFINHGANSYERLEYLSIIDNHMDLVIQEFK